MSIPIKIKRKADGSIDNITFCPTVKIEKQVWESTLHRSMVLQAENERLRDLLKEILGKLHYINSPTNKHNVFSNDFMKRIDEVLK